MKPIGAVHTDGSSFSIEVAEPFRPALQGLDGFQSHSGSVMEQQGRYRKRPMRNHLHKTRHKRPGDHRHICHPLPGKAKSYHNPGVAPILTINHEAGIIMVAFIDADDTTPVLDIKPYLPCTERVRDAHVAAWAAHWPAWYEDNATFDWAAEFTFET